MNADKSLNLKNNDKNHINKLYFFGILMWMIASIFYGLDYLQHTIPSVLIEPIAKQIGVSYIDVANIMSVYFPVYAISQIPAGYLIDRFGLRITLFSACLVVTIGLFMMLAPYLSAILIGRVFIGIGSAFAFIGALKTASVWLPENRFSLFLGITQMIGVIGGLLGQTLITYLIKIDGWQGAIHSIFIFGLTWSFIILFFLKNNKKVKLKLAENKKNQSIKFLLVLMKDKNIWLLALYAGIIVGTIMSTFAELYDIIFLTDSFNITKTDAAYISSFIFIGVGIGAPLHGILINYFKSQKTYLILNGFLALIVFACVPLSALFSLNTFLLPGIFFILGFFTVSMLITFSIAKSTHEEEHHGIIFAFINTIIGLSGFIFPILFGTIIKFILNHFQTNNQFIPTLFLLLIPIIAALIIATQIQIKNSIIS